MKQVTALAAWRPSRGKHSGRDLLVIGTSTSLLVYDAYLAANVFFRESLDAVSCVAVGPAVAEDDKTVELIIGRNGSIQGIDFEGKERLWIATGDRVTAIALVDIDGNGEVLFRFQNPSLISVRV